MSSSYPSLPPASPSPYRYGAASAATVDVESAVLRGNSVPSSSSISPNTQQSPEDKQDSSGQKNGFHIARIISPSLELLTAGMFLLNIPNIHNKIQDWTDHFPKHSPLKRSWRTISKLSNPRNSNLFLVATILCRGLFNSSIGINLQQASMVFTNILALGANVPLLIMMERAIRKHGMAAAHPYSKSLALINLMLSGLFATGFVQKARKDNKKPVYVHDMRNLTETVDFKNQLSTVERLQRGLHELGWLSVDSVKGYHYAWKEVCESFSSREKAQSVLNPLNTQGNPGRVAFSAFTMPLGALLALINYKNHPHLMVTAAGISIVGNLENGLALALSASKDKEQPFRPLGIVGGLASPIAEGVLTAKNVFGPAAMTASNGFQDMYQATAWASTDKRHDQRPPQEVVLNQNHLLPKPDEKQTKP